MILNANVTKYKYDKIQKWQIAKIPYINNPKYSILGVPIENPSFLNQYLEQPVSVQMQKKLSELGQKWPN